MDIAKRIKELRKAKGLTQKELAKASGVAEITIRKYENHDRQPKIEQIEKIASALEVSPFDIMGVDYWEEKYNPDGKLADEVKLLEQIESTFGCKAAELIDSFKNLNETGRSKAASYVSDLCEIEIYRNKQK